MFRQDLSLAIDILKALDKHGFSPNEKRIIKKIYGSNISDFQQWLRIVTNNLIDVEDLVKHKERRIL